MRKIPDLNFPAFDGAAKDLRSQGHVVVSPAEHDREILDSGRELDMKEVILWDLQQVADCDAIIRLPGSEHSAGVAAETALANFLGIEVVEYGCAVH